MNPSTCIRRQFLLTIIILEGLKHELMYYKLSDDSVDL